MLEIGVYGMDNHYVLIDKYGHYAVENVMQTHTGVKNSLEFVSNVNEAGLFSDWAVTELKKFENFDKVVAKLSAVAERKVTLLNVAD